MFVTDKKYKGALQEIDRLMVKLDHCNEKNAETNKYVGQLYGLIDRQDNKIGELNDMLNINAETLDKLAKDKIALKEQNRQLTKSLAKSCALRVEMKQKINELKAQPFLSNNQLQDELKDAYLKISNFEKERCEMLTKIDNQRKEINELLEKQKNLKIENKKFREQIKRNINSYGGMY